MHAQEIYDWKLCNFLNLLGHFLCSSAVLLVSTADHYQSTEAAAPLSRFTGSLYRIT